MPEKIEEILRAIHILVSRGELYEGDPDRVILSKRELFDTLENLNYAVAEMMDKYEVTTTSRDRAKSELEQIGQSIIDNANLQAEDVYAASLLYTDGALNEVYAEIVDARADIRREYKKFEEDMSKRLDVLRSNQKELMDQLSALSQGRKYFALIEDYNKRLAETQKTEEENAKKTKEKGDKDSPVIPDLFRKKTKKAGELPALNEIVSEKEQKKADIETALSYDSGYRALIPMEDEEIEWPEETMDVAPISVNFNTNWGTRENNILESGGAKTKKEREREKKYGKKPAKKKSKYDFGDEEIQLTVDPVDDPDAPIIITPDSLDAEYERWQAEQQGNPESAEEKDGEAAEKFDDLIAKASGIFGKFIKNGSQK